MGSSHRRNVATSHIIVWLYRSPRVSPFRKNFFSLISEIKRIWIRFTCVSLFHYKISLLFFRFFSLIFASNFLLRFTWVIFASKRNKAKRNSSQFFRIFSLFSLFFRYFLHFFALFCFFSLFFALNFSLRFDLAIFASKRNKGKRNSSLFFRFFRLTFVLLWFFHLIFAYFTFVFASDFWCFASKWIMWNQAFFSLPSETKFSLQFQISLPKRKWGRTLRGSPIPVGSQGPVFWMVLLQRLQSLQDGGGGDSILNSWPA